jgi:hypothetical protein
MRGGCRSGNDRAIGDSRGSDPAPAVTALGVDPVRAPTRHVHARRPHPDANGAAWSPGLRRALRVLGLAVSVAWLVGLVAYSTAIYHRANLTADFASYNQAWTLIGQGHLNPFDTVWLDHVPFIRNDFELIVWPLALLHVVDPQPVILLWIQDLAIAAGGLAIYLWIIDYLERRAVSRWLAVTSAVTVLALIVANPGVYQTLLFDFHMEPISTLFLVLAGRDLWLGRQRRAWIWIAVTLLCGSFAAIMVIGLGVSALLAGSATRRSGLLLVVAGLGWLGLITAVGANVGSVLDYYAYLAGRSSLPAGGGVALILVGMLSHPSRVIDQLHARLHYLWLLVKPVGIVGLASAWGFGVPVTVLVVDALNSQVGFIFQAFQNFAVFPFVLLGTVMVLVWTAQRVRWGWAPAVVVAVVVTATALTYGVATSPGNLRYGIAMVGPDQAAQLRRALDLTPPSAQVVVTIGVMGRFSGRQPVYFYDPGRRYPIAARPVTFVFDAPNENTVPFAKAADDQAADSYVRNVLHARVLVDAAGVTAYLWSPPPGERSIVLPGAQSRPSRTSP